MLNAELCKVFYHITDLSLGSRFVGGLLNQDCLILWKR